MRANGHRAGGWIVLENELLNQDTYGHQPVDSLDLDLGLQHVVYGALINA